MSVTPVDAVRETVSRTTARRRRRRPRVVIEYRWRAYSAPDWRKAMFLECTVTHSDVGIGRFSGMRLGEIRDTLKLHLGFRLQGNGPLPQWKHQYVGSIWEPLWREVWVNDDREAIS